MEAGELGLAWARLNDAAFALSRIDRPADLARVLYNLASLALCMGDDTRAAALIDASQRFLTGGDAAVRAFLHMLSGEILLRKGQLEACAELLEEALAELPAEFSPIRTVLAARAALAQLSCGKLTRMDALLEVARSASSEADVNAALELAVAEIRAALARGDAALAEQLAERGMQRISGQTPFAERLRFLLAALDAARGSGKEAALRERTLLCRAMLEAALTSLSPPQRAGMRARPEYARVLAAPSAARELRSAAASDRWRKLVQSTRRLFGSAQRSRIASQLVELALELVHAERALLVVCTDEGALQVRARAELGPEQERPAVFSRSVVQRVWSEGKSLVTIEASRDLRLHAAQSIHALSVRSVLALPVDGFGEAAVLYLDDRLRAEAFGADDLELLEDLAALTREALRAAQVRSRDARRARKAEQEVSALNLALTQAEPGTLKSIPLIGTSPALGRVVESARRVAKSDVSVLVTGDSGTGKELLARLIHEESARRTLPFVAESCAALPDTLLESALFGHVRGAFTGADRARRGLFEAADKGTLFLDEVGEMSPALQAKLLRVLQEGELRPLGSERTRQVDVRVIAATRQDLRARVRDGSFREDLYYRLAVVTVELPPLSARREDIPLLVRHFMAKHQGKQRGAGVISSAALRAFSERDYPGNVRQLENEVRRALALCEEGRIELRDLPEGRGNGDESSAPELSLHAQLGALSDKLVSEALRRAEGNVTQAAALLGISRFGLQKMLKRTKPDARQRK
jgi:transcriptional regulator with GAF, ATPase, and Fis domain